MRKYLLFLLLLIGSAVHAEELDVVTQAFPNEGAPYPLNAYSQILTGATPTVSTLGSPTDLNTSPGFSMCVFDSRPGFFSQATVYWSPDKITWKASVSKGPGCYFFLARARYVYIASTGAIGSTINVQLATANYMPFTNASGQNLTVTANQGNAGTQAWFTHDTQTANVNVSPTATGLFAQESGGNLATLTNSLKNITNVIMPSGNTGLAMWAPGNQFQAFTSFTGNADISLSFTAGGIPNANTIWRIKLENLGANTFGYSLDNIISTPAASRYIPIPASNTANTDDAYTNDTCLHITNTSGAFLGNLWIYRR